MKCRVQTAAIYMHSDQCQELSQMTGLFDFAAE
jgi:hypothetical protein